MTQSEITAFFPGRSPYFGALNYAVPTRAWLHGPFWDFFKARYWAEDLDKWKFRWECRDFARAYACAAMECWAATAAASESDALAVGEIWFVPDPGKPTDSHAVCAVFTENGLEFIEPQTNALCPMSPEQLSSRFFVRF